MHVLNSYLLLSALLFLIGLFGALTRRNAIWILMCLELMLNAVNIAFVAINRYGVIPIADGYAVAILVFALAGAEAGVGIALFLCVFRHIKDIDINRVNLLKW